MCHHTGIENVLRTLQKWSTVTNCVFHSANGFWFRLATLGATVNFHSYWRVRERGREGVRENERKGERVRVRVKEIIGESKRETYRDRKREMERR